MFLNGASDEEIIKYRKGLVEAGKYYNPDEFLEIYSEENYVESKLSNFAKTNFVFDNIQINSIEGFLQSLKTSNPELQKEIYLLPVKKQEMRDIILKDLTVNIYIGTVKLSSAIRTNTNSL